MGNCVLQADNITKVFPGVRALQSVTIDVMKGEVLGLIGENGAGKSTLLKILNGWYPYGTYKGTIRLDGLEQKFHTPHDAHVKGIGFVPQEIDVLNELSIAENIFVGNLPKKHSMVSMNMLYSKTSDFLQRTNINLDPRAKVRMLGIGQKQLLMIARALSRQPKVLILDEPTTALTHDDVTNLFNIVKKLKENGTSIIFVTHKLEEIMNLTDRVTVLRDGRYISTYSKDEYDDKQIITDMVGRKISNMYPERDISIGEEILRVEDITVEHLKIKGKNLISNIGFSLKKGEVLGLAGLVGSGRTEVLSALYGCYNLKSGNIFVNGRKVSIKNNKDAIRQGFAFVTEDRKYNGLLMQNNIRRNMTISNLREILKSGILNEKKEKTIVQSLFKELNIKAQSVESMVISLSGGNQQKVVISKGLNNAPRILLLDEPTKGIDVGAKNEIYCLINKLVETGISIVMVSSELPELIAMCDRFLIMANGRIVGELSKAETTQEKIMEYVTSST